MSGRTRARADGNNPDRYLIRSRVGGLSGPLARDLDARSLRVLASARELVGVGTGTLLTSIRRESGVSASGAYIDVVAGVPGLTDYLMAHHDGAPPHVIRPRRRQSLRFIVGGRVVFARRVNHPGNRGTQFLTRALQAAR